MTAQTNLWGKNAVAAKSHRLPQYVVGQYARGKSFGNRIYKVVEVRSCYFGDLPKELDSLAVWRCGVAVGDSSGQGLRPVLIKIRNMGTFEAPAKVQKDRWVAPGWGRGTQGWYEPCELTAAAPSWLR